MGKLIIYIDHIVYINGIYTWLINMCTLLKDDYDITILSRIYRPDIKDKLEDLVNVELWKEDEKYETDIILYSIDFVKFPSNIIAKKEFKLVHCDYSNVQQDLPDTTGNFIAVSKIAAEGFTKRYNIPCDSIESFVYSYKPRKVLELISCSRIYNVKGIRRMYEFADELDANGIPYRWINYTEIDRNGSKFLREKNSKQIIHLPSVDNKLLYDFIAKADYLVQFSECEGYCYAVHEALNVGTPVICTDIPIFRDLIQNGVNGYKTPLHINEIVNNIPKGFTYKEDIDSIKAKWKEVLS